LGSIIECSAFGCIGILSRPESERGPCINVSVSTVNFVECMTYGFWLYVSRPHETHLLAKRDKLVSAVASGRACLRAAEAGWQCSKLIEHLCPARPDLRERASSRVDRVVLENVLGDVGTYDVNPHVDGRLRSRGRPSRRGVD
jgi:hypothetical protein